MRLILLSLLFLQTTQLLAQRQAEHLYWTSSAGDVARTNLTTGATDTLYTNKLGNPEAMGFDPLTERLFWATNSGTTWRLDIEGGRINELDIPELGYVTGVVVDYNNQHVYWMRGIDPIRSIIEPQPAPKILRTDYEGKNVEVLVDSELGRPGRLQLDVDAGFIFWQSADTTWRTNLDGTGRTPILTNMTSFMLDDSNDHMYWSDPAGAIVRGNLSGTPLDTLLTEGGSLNAFGPTLLLPNGEDYLLFAGYGISRWALTNPEDRETILSTPYRVRAGAIDASRNLAYWIEEGHIKRMNTDGSNEETLFISSTLPNHMAADPGRGMVYWQDFNRIFRYDALTGSVEEIYQPPIEINNTTNWFNHIELDTTDQKLYFTNNSLPKMQVLDLQTGVVDSLQYDRTNPDGHYARHIVFDHTERKLYWASSFLFRSDPDGANIELLSGASFDTIDQFALHDDEVFWVRLWPTRTLNRSGIDLLNRESLVTLESTFDGRTDEVVIDPITEIMYWDSGNHILYSPIDSINIDTLLTGINATGLALMYSITERVSTDAAPVQSALEAQVYPNPFVDQLNIRYTLPSSQDVRLEIYDMLGRQVAILIDRHQPTGHHTLTWNGYTHAGTSAPNGTYVMRLVLSQSTETRLFTRIR